MEGMGEEGTGGECCGGQKILKIDPEKLSGMMSVCQSNFAANSVNGA